MTVIAFYTQTIPLAAIIKRDDLQPRLELDADTVDAYAKIYTEHGVNGMDPIRVHEMPTPGEYILTRGFTRCAAAEQAGLTEILAEILPTAETAADLLLDSLGGNKHGLRLNSADKRRAVALYHEQVPQDDWASSRDVGKLIGCSHELVAAYRRPAALVSEIDSTTYPTKPADAKDIILTAAAELLRDSKPLTATKLLAALQNTLPTELMELARQNMKSYGWTEPDSDDLDYSQRQAKAHANITFYDLAIISIKHQSHFCHTAYVKEHLAALLYNKIKDETDADDADPIEDIITASNLEPETIHAAIAKDDRLVLTETTIEEDPPREDFDSEEEWYDAEPIERTVPAVRLSDALIKQNKKAEKERRKKENIHNRLPDPNNYLTDRLEHIRRAMADHLDKTHGIELSFEQLAEIVLHIGLEETHHRAGESDDIRTLFNGVVLAELQTELECGWRPTGDLPDLDKLCSWIGADYDSLRIQAENTHPEPTPEAIAAYEAQQSNNPRKGRTS